MNKILEFLVIVISIIVFTSCDKEIKINDDYKDITIVYGLIDPLDSISYLRIEKAFLSDGDIFQAAQVADSNIYSYKLDVKILDDQGSEIVVFDTVTVFNKEEGVFYAPVMMVYYAVTKGLFKDDESYHLQINNPRTGDQITASTKLINGDDVNIDKPNARISFEKDGDIEFDSEVDMRLYQANIRFYYGEEDLVTGDSAGYYVDWVQTAVTSQTLLGGEDLEIPYSGDAFYANLENNIPVNADAVRYIGTVDIILSVADDIFNIYMDVNKPSASLVIDRPAYTNINNGYGIFASRSKTIKNVTLTPKSKALLWDMEDLNFQIAGGK